MDSLVPRMNARITIVDFPVAVGILEQRRGLGIIVIAELVTGILDVRGRRQDDYQQKDNKDGTDLNRTLLSEFSRYEYARVRETSRME